MRLRKEGEQNGTEQPHKTTPQAGAGKSRAVDACAVGGADGGGVQLSETRYVTLRRALHEAFEERFPNRSKYEQSL